MFPLEMALWIGAGVIFGLAVHFVSRRTVSLAEGMVLGAVGGFVGGLIGFANGVTQRFNGLALGLAVTAALLVVLADWWNRAGQSQQPQNRSP